MNTEQAHSLLPPARHEAPVAATKAGPVVWLNLVCLDAPIVAVVWLWLFARTFQVPFHAGNTIALFLTAWLIYLADRLADAASLKVETPRSLRQNFCLRHREIWITGLVLISGFDLYVIWRSIAAGTFFAGSVVGILALIYLALNYPRGLIWRWLPAKELAVGFLFIAGTLVALLPAAPSVTAPFITCGLAFACLCSLNCISIASWERELDLAQGKVSVATRHPNFTGRTDAMCAGLALACFALMIADRAAAPILGCVCVSAVLLGWLNASPDFKEGRFENRRSLGMDRDQRTAMADLVLLTSIIPLILMAS